ncbi:UDP-N-acetylmuramate dehydrogenase [Candidatus Parcubacteria bacterium]|jgi:UDP-N-acetylmuramate dehydrogenase|nr:MAG: UDP-N-acetylmuramate dehydrogenase [Candidatus Parcubacteria bacterium]
MSTENFLGEIKKIPGLRENVPLSNYTTFKVGGPAKFFLEGNDPVIIQKAVKLALMAKLPFSALGGGSNVLVSDKGFPGLIIKLKSEKCVLKSADKIQADAGTSLAKVIQFAFNKKLFGLEFAVGIPGSFGGAVAGNAGTSGHGIAEFVENLIYLDKQGNLRTCEKPQLDVSYRYTRFKYTPDEIIISAVLKLPKLSAEESKAAVKDALAKRSWQPKGAWCAGCVFKNPANNHAGRLIDQAGLKGKKIGGAEISQAHGNFIVNSGTATAEDIVILISYIKQQIRDKFGVQLEEEVRYLGF